MARTGFFHHIGTFLLFSASILLIITCISAPVVHNIAIMRVDFYRRTTTDGPSNIAFGTFGYCENYSDSTRRCTKSQVGYSPYRAVTSMAGTNTNGVTDTDMGGGFDDDGNVDWAKDGDSASATATRRLTRAMILHPIACGLNFIAFMLALGAGVVGSLLASMVALLAFLTTAVVMIIDFVMFSIVRTNLDDWTNTDDDTNGIRAYYDAAAWTTLASAICSLIGTIVVFFTCCSGRMHKRRERRSVVGPKTDYGEPVGVAGRRRRRFGIF